MCVQVCGHDTAVPSVKLFLCGFFSVLLAVAMQLFAKDVISVQASGVPAYLGRVGAEDTNGLDTAYRILADHARMFTVAISDGLVPSNSGLSFVLFKVLCVLQIILT